MKEEEKGVKIKKQELRIGAPQLRLLERLCNACSVSGDEGEVRKIVLEQIKLQFNPNDTFIPNPKTDALGNILAFRQAQSQPSLKVLITAHIDEVGLMVTKDENDGFFRFDVVGSIDKRLLVGKAVWVGKDHIPGVIGAKPIHLATVDELKHSLSVDDLRIDVSPENKSKVKIGERAVFAAAFKRLGASVRGKALDDRLGVVTLIELLKQQYAHLNIMAAFTVQEEIGLRGAAVAAYAYKPDLAIVLDCTPAYDLPHWEVDRGEVEENTYYNTKLGAGAAIYVADGRTISDPRLVKHFIKIAAEECIPYQIRQPGGGGTDGGAIHVQHEGIPTISISVPARYIHTPYSIARIADWQSTLSLVHASLQRCTPQIFDEER